MDKRYLEMIFYRGVAELRSEASRNYLGMIWWFLEPVLYTCVFYLVFAVGFRAGGADQVSFLLCGLIAWKWFDSSVRGASTSISSSAGLMGQIYFPKLVLPLSLMLSNMIKFLIILTIFFVYLAFRGIYPAASWLWLPGLMLVQLFLTVAVGLCAAAIVPFIPDIRYVINYGMTMLFFMSGIFFDIRAMSSELQSILLFNPVVKLLDGYRAVLLLGEKPDLAYLGLVLFLSLALTLLMFWLLTRLDRVYPKVVS